MKTHLTDIWHSVKLHFNSIYSSEILSHWTSPQPQPSPLTIRHTSLPAACNHSCFIYAAFFIQSASGRIWLLACLIRKANSPITPLCFSFSFSQTGVCIELIHVGLYYSRKQSANKQLDDCIMRPDWLRVALNPAQRPIQPDQLEPVITAN